MIECRLLGKDFIDFLGWVRGFEVGFMDFKKFIIVECDGLVEIVIFCIFVLLVFCVLVLVLYCRISCKVLRWLSLIVVMVVVLFSLLGRFDWEY